MNHYKFTVDGLKVGCERCKRQAAQAAFDIPDVVAVGIDEFAGTVTVTSDRPIAYSEFSAATAAIGFRTISVCETTMEMAS